MKLTLGVIFLSGPLVNHHSYKPKSEKLEAIFSLVSLEKVLVFLLRDTEDLSFRCVGDSPKKPSFQYKSHKEYHKMNQRNSRTLKIPGSMQVKKTSFVVGFKTVVIISNVVNLPLPHVLPSETSPIVCLIPGWLS